MKSIAASVHGWLSKHDIMVQTVAQILAQKGYTKIKADHISGFQRPEKIYWESTGKGHIPDVTAKGNAGGIIIEIETADSLGKQESESQMTLFSAFGRQHNCEIWLAVPKSSVLGAWAMLNKLNINNVKVLEL